MWFAWSGPHSSSSTELWEKFICLERTPFSPTWSIGRRSTRGISQINIEFWNVYSRNFAPVTDQCRTSKPRTLYSKSYKHRLDWSGSRHPLVTVVVVWSHILPDFSQPMYRSIGVKMKTCHMRNMKHLNIHRQMRYARLIIVLESLN